jgi:hypothetical protein
MREDPATSETPVVLAASSVTGPSVPATEPAVAVSPSAIDRVRRTSRPRVTVGPLAAKIAIGALLVGSLAIVAAAASGPSILVPRSAQVFPNWEAGPLHDIVPRLITNPNTLGLMFSLVLVGMIIAYLVLIAGVRTLSMRMIATAVVALHVVLVLSPPMQLTDIFNYLGYARLGALHDLNPYTHVIKQELFDPVNSFASWHNLRSPYGWLFTALTYPLAFVSLPIAYWAVKIVTVALSLGFVALVWECARRLGRDPRFAVAFVAFNPIFLIYAVAGFHNDFFMLVPMLGSIALLLARRDRTAGAVLMLAVAVKFTAIILLPFLLVGARVRPRQIRVLGGAALGAIPLIILSVALFGLSIPNLSQQSSVLTGTSIPNLFGLVAHLGGATPLLLKVAAVGVVVVVAYEFYTNRDWPAAAGWSTVALVASLGWLMPWYVVWLLPLAALGSSVRLRRVALALTVFLVLAFVPYVNTYMNTHNINLLNTSAGRAATSLQDKLAR